MLIQHTPVAALPGNHIALIQQPVVITQHRAFKLCMLLILVAASVLYVRPIVVESLLSPAESEQVIQARVNPLLQTLHANNLKAVEQLKHDIQFEFSGYRSHVPAFVDGLTGIGSSLGLLGVMAWDGKQIATRAVQATFYEQVVSPQAMRQRLQSHWSAYLWRLQENRTNFMVDLGAALSALPASEYRVIELKQRLKVVQTQERELAHQLAVKAAVIPILSTSAAYFIQTIATRIIARLPARTAPALLLKATKSNVVTGLIFMSVDFAVSQGIESEMTESIYTQMQQAEASIQTTMQHRAKQMLLLSEHDLESQITRTIHAEVK